MSKADELMARTVETLIAKIESGSAGGRWEMPWKQLGEGMPENGVSHRKYTGGNVLVLMMTQLEKGYPLPLWATYKQWTEAGGQVRKGEKATEVVLWKPVEAKEGDPEGKRRLIARVFHVFNVAQQDGAPVETPDPILHGVRPSLNDGAQQWLLAIPHGCVAGNPSYARVADVIRMPSMVAFDSSEDYFATYAHELAHWTGHESRLAREFGKRFGDRAYAFEELVAELSAAFTCAQFGITPAARSDHSQYLRSWIDGLRAEPSILWSVASKAQAATEYLNKFSEPAVVPEEETVAA